MVQQLSDVKIDVLLFPSWSHDGCCGSSHHYKERKKDQRGSWKVKSLDSLASRYNRSRQVGRGLVLVLEEPDFLCELESRIYLTEVITCGNES